MTTASGGLVGLYHKARHACEGALVRIFVFMVCGAAVLSIIENTGIRAAGGGIAYWKLLLLGLGAIIAELIGVHRAVMAWHGAHKGQTAAWTAVWIVGFGFSVYNAIGSAAETQVKRATVQKAAMTSYQDVRSDLDSARNRVKAEEKSVADLKAMTWQEMPKVDGQPVMSPAAADALIKGAEGNARFWGITKGCTDAQGPQARKFCANYAAAQAAKADLLERASWQAKIEAAEKQLTDARAALKTAMTRSDDTAVQTSDVTPFVGLVSYVSGAEPEKIQWIETFQTSFTNMLLVSLAGVVMALTAVQGKARTPWFNLRRRLSGLIYGRNEATTSLPTSTALVPQPLNSDEWRALLAQAGRNLKAA